MSPADYSIELLDGAVRRSTPTCCSTPTTREPPSRAPRGSGCGRVVLGPAGATRPDHAAGVRADRYGSPRLHPPAVAAGRFLAWCGARGLRVAGDRAAPRGGLFRTHPGSVPTVKQHLAAIRGALVLAVKPGRVGAGAEARRDEGRDAGPDAGGGAGASGPDRHGDAGRAAGPGAPERAGLQLRAGERGRGDASPGLLPAGAAGVAAAAREGREAARCAGAPPGRGSGRGVSRRRRRRGREGAAVPERGPGGLAERAAAGAPGRPGDDQAGITAYLSNGGTLEHWSTRSGSPAMRRRRRRNCTTGRRTWSRSTRSSAS